MVAGPQTSAVWSVFLDFPAQLGDVFPSPGTASLVQLLDVARSLCAFGLRCCQLLKHAEHDVARECWVHLQGGGDLPPWC